jgi:hypothetical protein
MRSLLLILFGYLLGAGVIPASFLWWLSAATVALLFILLLLSLYAYPTKTHNR